MNNLHIIRAKEALPCVILIGMPGSGKSTIGFALAKKLAWPYLDTDHLIEAVYGRRLQDIVDCTTKEEFLDIEGRIILSLRAQRMVLGTGGSVVYRAQTMEHLKHMGPIVHLQVALKTIQARIARNPERGIAIEPNQTLEDLYEERRSLYQQWSDIQCKNDTNIQTCVEQIYAKLQGYLSTNR